MRERSQSALADLLTRAASSAPRPPKSSRATAFIERLRLTGVRSGELFSLKWRDLPERVEASERAERLRRLQAYGGQKLAERSNEADVQHASDCAVHREPAFAAGPCDCGAAA